MFVLTSLNHFHLCIIPFHINFFGGEMETFKAYFNLMENFHKCSMFRKVSSVLLGF